MPILQIRHDDGREFNVAEAAYNDLYKPFGFKPVGVVYDGAVHSYSKENVEAATAYEKAGNDPNTTYVTLETEARQAADSGQEKRADDLTKQSRALAKSQAVTFATPESVPDVITEDTAKATEKPANGKA